MFGENEMTLDLDIQQMQAKCQSLQAKIIRISKKVIAKMFSKF